MTDSNRSKTIHLFCGSSIGLKEAEAYSRGRWVIHSPIKRYDIPRVLKESQDAGVICIIDGMFFSSESVSLTEIRDAIASGWKVMGCSSMGALRALEAGPVGMSGYGRVYRWLRLFQVEDDDEVAQMIDPETWLPISLAMVDIRSMVRSLVRSGRISSELGKYLVREMKALFFPHRTLGAFVRLLQEQLKTNGPDIAEITSLRKSKQVDAHEMLKLLESWSS